MTALLFVLWGFIATITYTILDRDKDAPKSIFISSYSVSLITLIISLIWGIKARRMIKDFEEI